MIGTFLFRIDAGKNAGLGHFQRCSILARALARRGNRCFFAHPEDAFVEARLKDRGFPASLRLAAGGKDETGQLGAYAAETGARAVVVDSYAYSAPMMRQLRDAGRWVAAIDDFAREPFACQLVVNGALSAAALDYRSLNGDTCFLLGGRYALLSEEFRAMKPREPARTVRRILVTVGAMDKQNILPRIVDSLNALKAPLDLDVVAGPYAESLRALEAAAGQSRHRIRIVQSPESLARWMREDDLAVTAGGQTLLEAGASGMPSVIIQTAANQQGNIQGMVEAGAAVFAGPAQDEAAYAKIADLCSKLSEDFDRRSAMARAGQQLLDGLGAERVADQMEQLC